MRALALQRYREFEAELGPKLTRFAVAETVRRMRDAGDLLGLADNEADDFSAELADELTGTFARWLAKNPALEDVTRITQRVAQSLGERNLFRTWFELTDQSLKILREQKVPAHVLGHLAKLKGKQLATEAAYLDALREALEPGELQAYQKRLLELGRKRLDPA